MLALLGAVARADFFSALTLFAFFMFTKSISCTLPRLGTGGWLVLTG